MLYRLVTRQARDRQEVARLLGVHRHTIGRWLARYAAGGLDASLATYIPPGKPVSLAPAVRASLEQALRRPEGFASYEAKRYGNGCDRFMGWRPRTKRFTPWCACGSRLSSTWPDLVTPKSPEAIPAFQTTCGERLQAVIPPANTRPVRVSSRDDSGFGLLTIRRRRLTAPGVQPVGSIQHVFEWCYVYGAVEPTTGDRFFREWPYLNAEMFQLFADAFAHAFPDSPSILVWDNSWAHTSSQLTLPEDVRLLFLPPYGPELNPIERVWRDLKDDVAWLQCADLDAQEEYLTLLLQGYEAATLQALTGYPYLMEAIHALSEVISNLRKEYALMTMTHLMSRNARGLRVRGYVRNRRWLVHVVPPGKEFPMGGRRLPEKVFRIWE
jgi:transposase